LTRYALWVRLLFLLFRQVKVDPSWVDTLREQASRGTVIYVLEVQGILDWALLNYVLEKHNLPEPQYSNSRMHILLKPLVVVVLWPLVAGLRRLFGRKKREERFFDGVRSGQHGLIFLKREKLIALPGSNIGVEYLKRLAEMQETLDRPVVLLPQMIFWTPSPQRHRKGLVDLLLGSPNAPGIRRFLSFLMNPARATVTSGPPLDLRELLASRGEENRPLRDPEGSARTAQWLLHRTIDQEEKTVRGPMLKTARQIRDEMMLDPDFVTRAEALGAHMGWTHRQTRRRLNSAIREMVADFRIGYIELVSLLLTPVFRRLFSSFVVDREAIHVIRDALRNSPVVLVPSHRSRVDYLVLSYLLYLKGLVPPHIATGAHLNVFPLGSWLRHCGAFFVPDRKDGNPLLDLVLAQYMRKLLKEGHCLELFLEQGRSRTGKVERPDFGVLGHVMDAVVSGAVRDVTVIPVALSYERVVEVDDYMKELSGVTASKQELWSVVQRAEKWDVPLGRLYLTAGRPLSIASYLSSYGASPEAEAEEDHIEEPLRAERGPEYLLRRMGYLILDRINRATVVNPSGIAATVLLSHLRRGISMERFREAAGFLLHFARRRGYVLSITLERTLRAARQSLLKAGQEAEVTGNCRTVDRARGEAAASALDEALERFILARQVQMQVVDGLPVLSVLPSARPVLNYYRNVLLHVFQREGLVSVALRPRGERRWLSMEELESEVRFLSNLLKREFVFRVGDVSRGVSAAVSSLMDAGVLRMEEGRIYPEIRCEDRLQLFRNLIRPVLESYLACVRSLDILRHQGPLKKRELVRQILKRAQQEYCVGELTCQEALSTATLLNAVEHFVEEGWLTADGVAGDQARVSAGSPEIWETLPHLESRIRHFAGTD
jgi:glycerol-3-phosphate O-acyltransferase